MSSAKQFGSNVENMSRRSFLGGAAIIAFAGGAVLFLQDPDIMGWHFQ